MIAHESVILSTVAVVKVVGVEIPRCLMGTPGYRTSRLISLLDLLLVYVTAMQLACYLVSIVFTSQVGWSGILILAWFLGH